MVMRAFLAACVVTIVIGIGAAAILDTFVQTPASVAFATSAVRL
jgi:hypothetical protein